MIKILPLKMDTILNIPCWIGYRLAVILTDDRYLPWFIENFTAINMSAEFGIKLNIEDSKARVSIFDEVLERESVLIGKEIDIDIVELTREIIKENSYPLVLLDNYLLKKSNHYNKEPHYIHDSLIYGFDDERSEFHFISVNINNIFWGTHTISYDEYRGAFNSAYLLMKGDKYTGNGMERGYYTHDLPFSKLTLKAFDRKVNLRYLLCDLYEFKPRERENQIKLFGEEYLAFPLYGIDIYKGYYRSVFQYMKRINPDVLIENQYIMNGIRALLNNKRLLKFKYKYLVDNGIIEVGKDMILNFDKILKNIETVQLTIAKYNKTKKEKLLDEAENLLKETEMLESNVIDNFTQLVCSALKKQIFH